MCEIRGNMGTLVHSPQFYCWPNTALKNEILIKHINRTIVNIIVLSAQGALFSLPYLFKLTAFSQQQNKILPMKN